MVGYCEICGEELDPDEEEEGICSKCKETQRDNVSKSDNYIDPGIT